MSDDIAAVNTAVILDAGVKTAGIAPRLDHIEHPGNPAIRVPVALVETDEGGSRIELLTDVMAALDDRASGPRRRKGTTTLTDDAAFIAYLQRWGTPINSVVYANTAALSFMAVLDDNPPDDKTAAWREHRAGYTCPRSSEWKIWTASDGKPMRQAEFGDFLEARLEDMTNGAGYPAPTEVLQVARQLMVRTKGTFQREINVTTGDNILVQKTETETGSTQIPRAFLIAIPVFDGGVRYEMEARVRFALSEGVPAFVYTLHRRAEIERDAFDAVRKKVGDETKMLVLAGTP